MGKMRLTLRTLLAYLDDTLRPAEARDIGQQVNSEPAIHELVERIRKVMRRRRLMSDSPDPDHAELDPNEMAEYLDNLLSPGRIGDLEKRILEHDQDLAEAASVHQILTLVLGKPSDVPASARERAYRVGRNWAKTHTEQSPVGPRLASNGNERVLTNQSPSPVSFEPSRLSSKFGTMFAVLILLVVLAGTVFMTLRDAAPRALPPQAKVEESGDSKPVPAADMEAPADVETPAEPGPSISPDESSPPTATEEPTSTPTESIPPVPVDDLDPIPGREPSPLPDQTPQADAGTELAKVSPADVPTEKGEPETKPSPVEATDTPVEVDEAPAPVDPPTPIATYVGDQSILVRKGPERWVRLAANDVVFPGPKLANVGLARGRVEMTNGVDVELIGATRLSLIDRKDSIPAVDIEHGKILLTARREPVTVQVRAGSVTVDVVLSALGTKVAVERRLIAPVRRGVGGDEPPMFELSFLRGAGIAEVTRDGQTIKLSAGAEVLAMSDVAGLIEGGPPEDASDVFADGERPAATTIEQWDKHFAANRDPVEQCTELLVGSSRLDRVDAARSLAVLQAWTPLVVGLRRDQKEDVRRICFDVLREAGSEGTESLGELEKALVKRFVPATAETVARLILGFQAEEDRTVANVGQLITWMDADDFEVRELAFRNLEQFTGRRRFNYSPADSVDDRQVGIKRARDWLADQTDDSLK